jgi:hypothetical protein
MTTSITTSKPSNPGKDDTRRGAVALLLAFLKDRRVWAGLLVVLSLCFVGYQIRAASKKAEDKQQLEKVKEMVAEVTPKGSVTDVVKMFAKRDPAKEDEMRQKQRAIREEAKKLSPESQRELMQGQIKLMTSMTREVIKMKPDRRNAVLDLFIDAMEAGRKRAEQRAAQAKSGDSANGGDAEEAARRRGPRTDEERERGRRMFMDSMTAEDRATMIEGMRMVNDRRRERGLPPMPTGARRQ